jgi:hypothetical protein
MTTTTEAIADIGASGGGEADGTDNVDALVGGVRINVLRRAKDVVSNADVPFLLLLPFAEHAVLYDVITTCYGLVPRVYDTVGSLNDAREITITYRITMPSTIWRTIGIGEGGYFTSWPRPITRRAWDF